MNTYNPLFMGQVIVFVNSFKIIFVTGDLEKKTSEEQKEIEILQEKISLLSCQLEQNKAYNQKEINSMIPGY